MNIFYAPNAQLNQLTVLDETEAHHALHVLRMKQGEKILLFDGCGNLFNGDIAQADKRGVTVNVTTWVSQQPTKNGLHIAIAPTKQMERLEWFIEKAVEIGVGEITPVICARSERKELKTERIEKLIISACKQSKQYHLPKLNPLCKVQDFLKSELPVNRCIAWCETHTEHLKTLVQAGMPLVCLIGPEGDFTAQEVDIAISHSFKPVSLGTSILRSETAGVYAAAVYNLLSV